MASTRLVYILCLHPMYFMAFAAQQPVMLYHDCVEQQPNYTSNSSYQTNLNNLFRSLYSNTEITNGFYNFSSGEDPDKVSVIALCRPDITSEPCRTCIRNASDSLLTLCPNFKEAVGGQDDCMVRYSNRPIFRLMEVVPRFWVYRSDNSVSDSNVTDFNKSRSDLLNRLRNEAAANDLKFSAGQIPAPNFQTIYALLQCTPDLTESECSDCLYNSTLYIPECCENRSGGRVIFPSCNFRYETNRFYNPDNFTSPSPENTSQGKKRENSRTIIIVVVTVAASAILAICIFIFLRRRKKNKGYNFDGISETEEVESLQFDFGTIILATDNFSEANKLGQGGFGAVYKGMLPNGRDIAVKRLANGSGQGELEFKNEVLLVAKLQHRNLVRLLGFCIEKEERLLVYEFVPKSSLNNFIFDPIKRADLDWETRYKIIFGIAKGLVYLHEDSRLRIIHRDLKASNILLDEEMNPKIADFGTARLFAVDQTRDETGKVVGTFGYMAPEYVTRGQYSVKSDVFSFGVIVLEIVSGQRHNNFHVGEEEEDLLTYAWTKWNEGSALNIIDPDLTSGSRSEIMRCIHIGLLCVQENEATRPTIGQIITVLSSNSVTLEVPLKPAFFMHSETRMETIYSSESNSRSKDTNESENFVVDQSRNEASISEMYPR